MFLGEVAQTSMLITILTSTKCRLFPLLNAPSTSLRSFLWFLSPLLSLSLEMQTTPSINASRDRFFYIIHTHNTSHTPLHIALSKLFIILYLCLLTLCFVEYIFSIGTDCSCHFLLKIKLSQLQLGTIDLSAVPCLYNGQWNNSLPGVNNSYGSFKYPWR